MSGTVAKVPQLRTQRARKEALFRWLVLTPVLLFLAIPLLSMVLFSLRYPLTGKWTNRAWQLIFGGGEDGAEVLEPLWEGLVVSLGLGLFTIVLMLALLLPVMLSLRLRPSPLSRIVEFTCLLPLAIPAIVLVVGLAPIYRWLAVNVLSTNSIWLALAYAILVLPYSYRALDAGFGAVNIKTLVEAGRSLGCSWFGVMFRIVIPTLRQAILSACFISIAVVMGEYTIASLLNRTNLQVGLFLVGQSDPMVATAMSLLTLTLGIVLLLTLGLVGSARKGRRS
ncbi:ABC transporter permease subunit [Luteococcus sp. H138]|uniref:ABC transporter permease n=1 Tax=unclassified Luteococcus TaxID=2639923 RepID=UPI00313CE714